MAAERAIEVVLQRLRSQGVTAVGVYATDTRDFLFLAKAIREALPDVQLFGTGADLLDVTRDYAPYMRGALLASTYLLNSDTQMVTPPSRGAVDRHQFQTMEQQGVYNAAIALIGKAIDPPPPPPAPQRPPPTRVLLVDYGPPSSTGSGPCKADEGCRPPVWIGVVGNDAIWPLHAAATATDYVPGVEQLEVRADPIRASIWAGALLFTILVLAGLHGAGYLLVLWHDDRNIRRRVHEEEAALSPAPVEIPERRRASARFDSTRDYLEKGWRRVDDALAEPFDWRRARLLWLFYPPSRTRFFDKADVTRIARRRPGSRAIAYASHEDTLRADRAYGGFMLLLLTSVALIVSGVSRTAWLWAAPRPVWKWVIIAAWAGALLWLGAFAVLSLVEFLRPGATLRGEAPPSPGTPFEITNPPLWSAALAVTLWMLEGYQTVLWLSGPPQGQTGAPLLTFGRWIRSHERRLAAGRLFPVRRRAVSLVGLESASTKDAGYPEPPHIGWMSSLMNGEDKKFQMRCQNAWTEYASWRQVRGMWSWLPLLTALAATTLGWGQGYTFEGRGFTWLVWLLTVATLVLMTDAIARGAHQGRILAEQLQRLGQHPIASAFARVAQRPFDWRLTLFQQPRLALAPLVDEIHLFMNATPPKRAHVRQDELNEALKAFHKRHRMADLEDPHQPLIATADWRAILRLNEVLSLLLQEHYWTPEARVRRAAAGVTAPVAAAARQSAASGSQPSASTPASSVVPAVPVDQADHERAEVIVGLQLAFVIRNRLARIVSGLTASLVGFGLVLAAHLLVLVSGSQLLAGIRSVPALHRRGHRLRDADSFRTRSDPERPLGDHAGSNQLDRRFSAAHRHVWRPAGARRAWSGLPGNREHAPGVARSREAVADAVGRRVTQGRDVSAARAAMTRRSASRAVAASAVRWPILRPGRALALPYRCSFTSENAHAASQRGSPSAHRSPSRFAIAAGRSSSVDPSGRPHTARSCCSNWLVTAASKVRCPELCGRGASSLIRRRPSRVEEQLDAQQPDDVERLEHRSRDRVGLGRHARRHVGRRRRHVKDVMPMAVLDRRRSARSRRRRRARRRSTLRARSR